MALKQNITSGPCEGLINSTQNAVAS